MSVYLCYDIRSVQSFIFAVPKLKYIVGGSALVDQFDRDTVPRLAEDGDGVELIASGGGRGMVRCGSETALANFIPALVEKAQERGFTLWLGHGAGYQAAGPTAQSSFAFLPNDTGSHPCAMSGLYPTQRPGEVHRLLKQRAEARDLLAERIIAELSAAIAADGELKALRDLDLRFPRDVTGDDAESRAAAAAFGPSGRWALLAMDGNDIGRQHAHATPMVHDDPDGYARWLTAMGRALDDCTWSAFMGAMRSMLVDWLSDGPEWKQARTDGVIQLPIRPLILGGDDLVTLIHPRYAMSFARSVSDLFAARAAELHDASEIPLWHATGGRLTMSAGILYAKRTYPLHAAIGYAESLLSGAKRAFRAAAADGTPPPAAVDWEHVTDGLIDSPEERRVRDRMFLDGDLGGSEVSLTARPWTFGEFERAVAEIESIIDREAIPRTILHGLAEGLRTGFWGRYAYRSRLGRRYPGLAGCLEESREESGAFGSGWRTERGSPRSLILLDVLSHLEEQHREHLAREVAS